MSLHTGDGVECICCSIGIENDQPDSNHKNDCNSKRFHIATPRLQNTGKQGGTLPIRPVQDTGLLAEVALQQAFESLAVTGFVGLPLIKIFATLDFAYNFLQLFYNFESKK